MKNNKIRVVTIEGPTAVGKSKLAMELAEYFSTEIISADSRQVYRYLDIGTAKPTEAEQAKVNHHLVDVVNPDEEYNAGSFRKDSLRICESLHSRDMLPLIVHTFTVNRPGCYSYCFC